MSGNHDHGGQAGHHQAHMCGGVDHDRGSYTPQQRADLDRVLTFNQKMAERIDASIDVRDVETFLDPDPLRYMWVDEGQGRIEELMARTSGFGGAEGAMIRTCGWPRCGDAKRRTLPRMILKSHQF